MVKRAKVTSDTFDEKKPNALDKLTGNMSPVPEKATEEEPEQAKTAGQRRIHKAASFYLDDSQLDKLDELAFEYKRATKKRINRNDIIRALVDSTSLENLLAIMQ